MALSLRAVRRLENRADGAALRPHVARAVRTAGDLGGRMNAAAGSIRALDLLPPTDEQQLLIAWNDTTRSIPSDSVVDLFEQRVRASPEAIALVVRDRHVTYRELDA